jgi:hypothetical protein
LAIELLRTMEALSRARGSEIGGHRVPFPVEEGLAVVNGTRLEADDAPCWCEDLEDEGLGVLCSALDGLFVISVPSSFLVEPRGSGRAQHVLFQNT